MADQSVTIWGDGGNTRLGGRGGVGVGVFVGIAVGVGDGVSVGVGVGIIGVRVGVGVGSDSGVWQPPSMTSVISSQVVNTLQCQRSPLCTRI